MFLTAWVALTALVLIGLGAFAYARNTRATTNKNFALFTLVLAAWIVANCLGANFKTRHFALYFTYADFSIGPLLVYVFWRFTYSQLAQTRVSRKAGTLNAALFGAALLTTILVLSHQVVRLSFEHGALVTKGGLLYNLYPVIVGGIALLSVANLLIGQRAARSSLRAQLTIMLWAAGITAAALLTANLLVPQITDSESINLIAGNLSYLGLVFFIALTTYAIVKHRLFDVRLVVARSIAYALVITVLVVSYTAFSISLSTLLPGGQRIAPQERLVYIGLAILAALVFPVLKRFFDRLTNRLFYRDAYEPQALFNRLNKVLVSTADLTKLLNGVIDTVNESIRAEFFMIVLMEAGAAQPTHVVGTMSKKFSAQDMAMAHSKGLMDGEHSAVIVADDLDYHEATLKKIMLKNDIAVLARLGGRESEHQLGHIILGSKKSGNPYTTQDVMAIETIANELVIAIQNALRFEEIENFNETLRQKIDDATRKLQRTNQKLRTLDETKDDFISMASHQLRTPLTSVKGYVSMVLDGDAGTITPLQRRLLNQSFISSQRMVYLISDLLNVSRLRTGKFVVEPIETNLAMVVKDEVDQLVETAKGRNVALVYHKPEHFPTLMLDETKMRQVIMNFLDNAIYYTPSGGRIEVRLEDKGGSLDFTVTDTGIGVPRAEQHHLFTKFFRADNAKRARPDGTGLGLFMAKKVIVTLGGAIIFRSKEGEGSTFGFTFAKNKVAATPKVGGAAAADGGGTTQL